MYEYDLNTSRCKVCQSGWLQQGEGSKMSGWCPKAREDHLPSSYTPIISRYWCLNDSQVLCHFPFGEEKRYEPVERDGVMQCSETEEDTHLVNVSDEECHGNSLLGFQHGFQSKVSSVSIADLAIRV